MTTTGRATNRASGRAPGRGPNRGPDGATGRALARLRGAASPRLLGDLDGFRAAVAGLDAAPRRPRTVAVVGLTPGEGRSSVAALMSLAIAGYSDRRIVAVDAADPGPGRLGTLLGAPPLAGGMDDLLAEPGGSPIPRRRLRDCLTAGAAVPLLSRPAGAGAPAPQELAAVLDRLRYRADVVVIDTPAGPHAPVLHAALDLADHFVIVARAEGDPRRRVAAAVDWLTRAPGPPRRRQASVALVARGLADPSWLPPDLPTVVIRRDEAVRRRTLDRVSRRTVTGALMLAAFACGQLP